MSDMLTVKEYAEYHRADPRTVRRWIKNGKLKAIKKKGCVWLIDSSQPRPTKRIERKTTKTKSSAATKPNVERTANVPTQTTKEPAKTKPAVKLARQADSAVPNVRSPIKVRVQCARSFSSISSPPAQNIAEPVRNPAFENELQALGPEPIEAEPIEIESISPEVLSNAGKWFQGLWKPAVVITVICLVYDALKKPNLTTQQQRRPRFPTRGAVLSHGTNGGRPPLQGMKQSKLTTQQQRRPSLREKEAVLSHGLNRRGQYPLQTFFSGNILSAKNRRNKGPI